MLMIQTQQALRFAVTIVMNIWLLVISAVMLFMYRNSQHLPTGIWNSYQWVRICFCTLTAQQQDLLPLLLVLPWQSSAWKSTAMHWFNCYRIIKVHLEQLWRWRNEESLLSVDALCDDFFYSGQLWSGSAFTVEEQLKLLQMMMPYPQAINGNKRCFNCAYVLSCLLHSACTYCWKCDNNSPKFDIEKKRLNN